MTLPLGELVSVTHDSFLWGAGWEIPPQISTGPSMREEQPRCGGVGCRCANQASILRTFRIWSTLYHAAGEPCNTQLPFVGWLSGHIGI